jgi:hypothetical protein
MTRVEEFLKILTGELKQVWQLKEGDIVITAKGKKEAVISIEQDKNDPRITHVKTKSGIWDSNTNGYVYN